MTVTDRARWFVVHLANKTTPAAAARRLGITVDQLARVCSGFPVRRRVVIAVEGALAAEAERLPKAA